MTGAHDFTVTNVSDTGIDAKSKVIIAIVLVITTTLIISYEQLIFLSILVVYLIWNYKINLQALIKKLIIPTPLIISLSLLVLLTNSSQFIVRFSEIYIIYTKPQAMIFYLLRGILVVVISLLLIESEPSFFNVIYALDELKLPKVMVNSLLLMYRSVIDISVEAKRMMDSRYSRTPQTKYGTSIYTYKILGYMIGGILARAFQRKETRKNALIARQFDGNLYHKKIKFTFKGLVNLWICTISALAILIATQSAFTGVGIIGGI